MERITGLIPAEEITGKGVLAPLVARLQLQFVQFFEKFREHIIIDADIKRLVFSVTVRSLSRSFA